MSTTIIAEGYGNVVFIALGVIRLQIFYIRIGDNLFNCCHALDSITHLGLCAHTW
jgi:hypothetical protein